MNIYKYTIRYYDPHNASKVPYRENFQKIAKKTFEIFTKNLAPAKDIRIFTVLKK